MIEHLALVLLGAVLTTPIWFLARARGFSRGWDEGFSSGFVEGRESVPRERS